MTVPSTGTKGTLLRRVPVALLVFGALVVAGRLASSKPGATARADAPAGPPAPAVPAPGPDAGVGKLVVHEWGTFTGFTGSDGVNLPFGTAVGSDLPEFVLSRAVQAARLAGKSAQEQQGAALGLLLSKSEMLATQRMETPVVYFYTDGPRDVDVRVEFPQGLITEFYPPVRAMGPAYETRVGEKLENSFLDWGRLHITPDSRDWSSGERGAEWDAVSDGPAGAGPHIPPVPGGHHYRHARETDSAVVQFPGEPASKARDNPAAAEKFLFYRGLGNFRLPVSLAAQGNDRFVLYNATPDPIRAAFLIRVEGDRARFARVTDVRGSREMGLPAESVAMPVLSEAVVAALVAEGLYEKEARAMVRTWEDSWFAEQGTGTRLLYTVPRPVTDGLLPLRVRPAPDETVRVLVGRVEVLTPEQEAKIGGMLARAAAQGAAGLSADEARSLRRLGRFLSPAIERAGKVQGNKLLQALSAAPAE